MDTAPTRGRVRRLVPEPASPLQAAAVVIATAGLVIFLIAHELGRPEPIQRTPPVAGTEATAQPVEVSPPDLVALASSLTQPIYWVGTRPNVTYELTQAGTNVAIRYLPRGFHVGDERPALTIHTYPLENAFAATEAIGNEPQTVFHRLPGGGFAAFRATRPTNIYIAYPGTDYQIEIYSPNPAEARSLVTNPDLQPVPTRP